MTSFVTKYVVSPSVDNQELRLSAHGVSGTFLPEELEMLGTFAAIYWNGPDHPYDVTVTIAPPQNLGAAHERNGKS